MHQPQQKTQQTRLIGLKEFRQSISRHTEKAAKYDFRYIVLKRNQPIGEYRPLTKKEQAFEKLAVELADAREQIKRGEYITLEELEKKLGL